MQICAGAISCSQRDCKNQDKCCLECIELAGCKKTCETFKEKISKDAAELENCIKLGKLKKATVPWHEYLKEKKLVLFKLNKVYNLLSVVGEKGIKGVCKWCYENNRKDFDEMGYESLEDWIEECELGNDGFGFGKDEIVELGGMEELKKQLGEIK